MMRKNFPWLLTLVFAACAGPLSAASPALELRKGDRIVLVGDVLAERLSQFGHLEAHFQAARPDLTLTFRDLSWACDTPTEQFRPLNFGDTPKHLAEQRADVILLCFGMTASFAPEAKLADYEKELDALVRSYLGAKFNGTAAPRLALLSPIAHEALGGQFPDPAGHNRALQAVGEATKRVAETHNLPFVDLYTPTAARPARKKAPWTINGIHLSESGSAFVAKIVADSLGLNVADTPAVLRQAIQERNEQFYYRFRAVNGEYIYGRRKEPFGVVNFPGEMKQLDELVAKGDRRIHAIAAGKEPEKRPLSSVQPPGETYGQSQTEIGGKRFETAADPEAARKMFKVADGYEISLFASEKDFPLHNPVAMHFDSAGKCWVSTNPSYPHQVPGVTPNDQILVLEDTDGDGKADKHTVFADGLYLPIGLEFGDGGVYVSAQPNLLHLKDTDGDGKADTRDIVLHGLGTGDSHHAAHAFHWGPDGGLYIGDGTFHRTQVETPTGPLRLFDAGWLRYEPRSAKVEAFVSYPFANPWGQVFDKFGQNFIADASGGANYFGLPITGHVDFPRKHPPMNTFTSKVRPTCGCELVSSRHFPDDAQGDFLVNNCIGFQGVKRHRVSEEGSGYVSKELEPLVYSADPNFRPVAIEFGPDGALYIVDWYNPLVGHMQFSVRDPGRDHIHGRIWRITAKNRPLVKPVKIVGESTGTLLQRLREPEDRTRYRVRRELRDRPTDEVVHAVKKWALTLHDTDERLLLEALWVLQQHNQPDVDLLNRALRAKEARVRAGAARVLRFWRDAVPDSLAKFRKLAGDEHPRVRLEAVVALSFYGSASAAEAALDALKHPTDYYLDYGLKETIATLEPHWKRHIASGKPLCDDNPAGAAYLLAGVPVGDLVKLPRSAPVLSAILSRDGILAEQRLAALADLAKINKTDTLAELLAAVGRLDEHHAGHGGHALHDLAQLLVSRPRAELTAGREKLEELANCGHSSAARQAARVAIITADADIKPTWDAVKDSFRWLRDTIDAVPLIPDAKLRATAWERVVPLASKVPDELAKKAKSATVTGRFVRIQLPGGGRTLTLAEVQVFVAGVNVAPKGKASQRSTDFGGTAEKAIDGNTDGVFADGSSAHGRVDELEPWWEVDLGEDRAIESVVIWNRTDGEFGRRLGPYTLSVLDAARKPVFTRENNPAPAVNARILLGDDPVRGLRQSAMSTVASIPGREAEAFSLLAGFIQTGDERDAAVRALRRVPRTAWAKDQVRPLFDSLVKFVERLPAAERSESSALDALQLGGELAALLPAGDAKMARIKLAELGVRVLLVRTVPHKMAFDRVKLYAEAGKPGVLILENPDIMPHNLLVTVPGAMSEVGIAAEKMALDPAGQAAGYNPRGPKVLFGTRLLAPAESQRLTFTAPKEPGEYPYVCTFPGHWRVMYGTLKVVADLNSVPPDELNAPPSEESTPGAARPFVRNWTLEELTPDLEKLERDRSFEKGLAMFKAASCVQCHRAGTAEGGDIGPNLLETAKKIADKKMTLADVLKEIVHPSAVIDAKYRTAIIVTTRGDVATGIVLAKKGGVVTLQAGPRDKPREIKEADIDEQAESKVSMMPEGLLVTLSKDEILDLLAYVVSGGDPKASMFRP